MSEIRSALMIQIEEDLRLFREVAGISRGYVGNYEKDRASPSVRTLLMFIAAIERAWAPFPRGENERLARFFLGPKRDGTLIVAKETIPLGEFLLREAGLLAPSLQ